jgi:hypothetical protein
MENNATVVAVEVHGWRSVGEGEEGSVGFHRSLDE